MSTNGKTLNFRAAKSKGFTVVRQPINLLHISFRTLKCLTGEH